MAIWAELKKAVNSNFDKPLNELIDEVKTEVETVYASSDNTTETILASPSSWKGDSSTGRTKYFGKFVPKHDGVVRLKCSGSSSTGAGFQMVILSLTDEFFYTASMGYSQHAYENRYQPLTKYDKLEPLSESTELNTSFYMDNMYFSLSNNTQELLIRACKGVPIYIVGLIWKSAMTATVNSIQICADEVSL